ncbi:MAG: DUF6491 family protein [Gammaproteobacteria bacterium]|nr:DUF6491 family protein [Gammaproteobacteria bacterium]
MKKTIVILLIIFNFTFIFSLKASVLDDENYIFDDLEQVDDFLYWQVGGWQAVDSRSLIVNINPSQSYLLILDRNVWAIKYTEQIKISSRNSRVRKNVDLVQVLNQPSRPGRIVSIYLLPDRESQRSVRAKIRGEEIEGPIAYISDGEII